jgi:hypothetical protein
LQVPSWPFFLLVDAEGVVQWRSHRFDGIEAAVERCVRAAAANQTGRRRAGRAASVPRDRPGS